MEDEGKDNGIKNIDNNLKLPSFINKKYLEKKFNEEIIEKKEEKNISTNYTKIIVENKKLTIFEVDETKKIENKIYESDDFSKVLKQLSKNEDEEMEDNFDFELVIAMKSGIFIIESENMYERRAWFIMKFNESKKEIEVLVEGNFTIIFVEELPNGNFIYNHSYSFYKEGTNDLFFYDIRKNVKECIDGFQFFDYSKLNLTIFENGFAYPTMIWPYKYLY